MYVPEGVGRCFVLHAASAGVIVQLPREKGSGEIPLAIVLRDQSMERLHCKVRFAGKDALRYVEAYFSMITPGHPSLTQRLH